MKKLLPITALIIHTWICNAQYVPNAIKSKYGSSKYSSSSSGSSYSSGGIKTGGIKTGYPSKSSYGGGSYPRYPSSGSSYAGSRPSYSSSGNSMSMSQNICNPPCQNGGKCISTLCLCPNEYTGIYCQYSKENCNFKNMNFNGGYRCKGDGESISCTIYCPEGSYFEYDPASVYRCLYATAKYEPPYAPQCLLRNKDAMWVSGSSSSHSSSSIHMLGQKPTDSKITRINVTNTEYGRKGMVTTILSRPGVCFTWGGAHFKTFDGKIYSFDSKCSHMLVRDSVDNTFSVAVQNSKNCTTQPETCHRIITLFLQGKQYYLKQGPLGGDILFGSADKILAIPMQGPGFRIAKSAHFVILSLDSIGAKIKWDGQLLVQLEVTESLWNKTEGLCGRIDGNPYNDLMMKNNKRPPSILSLATNWKVDQFGDVCSDIPNDKHKCQSNKVAELKAVTFCKKLLSDPKFAPCHPVKNTTVFLDACKWDYCSCPKADPTQCACEVMNIYVRECAHAGINSFQNWRDPQTCPMECTGGRIYKPCGPTQGQPTCGAATELPSMEEGCNEGCFCPEGTVLHDNQCITLENCPCKLRGKSFYAGQTIDKDCNTCTCQKGEWICTELSCGARCSIIGDPHYTTFDGMRYDFMGQCSYYLVKTPTFSIEGENVACAGSISRNMNFANIVTQGSPSCTRSITIKIIGQIITLKQNHAVVVNGVDVKKLPYLISGIEIKGVTSIFVQVRLPNEIYVWWDGFSRVYIDVPAKFPENTKGLCGTYNNNQKDDFLTPENDIEEAIIPFANKWKTVEDCGDAQNIPQTHPCDMNVQKKGQAEMYCSKMKSKLFQECYWRVDAEQFYKDCLYDMCSCGSPKVSKCLCPILAAYADECSRQGVQIDWRSEIRECGVQCTGGQKYQVCGNSCIRTCWDIAEKSPHCKQQCIEGCNCPEGEALNDIGECVPVGQCHCRKEGEDYPPGYKEIRQEFGKAVLCTCVNAIWSCSPANALELAKYSEPTDIRLRCNSSDNFQFSTCKNINQKTCKDMHSFEETSSSVCTPGCECKKGFVLDTTAKKCVKAQDCPCHHGGKSFSEGEMFEKDCNSCVCKHGNWQCSEAECAAECSAWGDSHYKTFDGKHYDYQGQCDYVFAKGSITTGSFDISIQSVPCGSLGTSCSKTVSIRISSGSEKESLTLTRGKPTPQQDTSLTHMTLRQTNLFVIVEAFDLGLIVVWDKGTRVYVKLDARWKNKVKGLCGNYNGNVGDDFQTPSGGITESSARIFGDSWKLQSYCPEALEIEDTCKGRPDRKIWSLRKCGMMKSQLFARCHSEVPVENYFDKCVFDSCACDEGGDCECLCTALAAYAEECNNKGVHIKWRSQKLCPIQCDRRCSTYSPCVSTCPTETCENLISHDKVSKFCKDDTCVEGCELKACPQGQVYYNSSYLECVPRSICKTVCLEVDGVTYYEGDIIESDDCHSCYCSRGQKFCKGQPCSKEGLQATQPIVEIPIEDLVKCQTGWTQWINQNKILPKQTKEPATQKDVEPLPSLKLLNCLEDSGVCSSEDMVKIQCRTVKNHVRFNETALDVTCDLEKGLICSPQNGKSCPDFEIRVLCQCDKKPNSTLEDIEKTFHPKNCTPGLVVNECAVQCDRLCLFYSYAIKESGLCQNGIKCEAGCVPEERKTTCPSGTVWANNQTCVSTQDCMCRSKDGKPVKPGTVVQESDCEYCQCIDNFYACDSSACNFDIVTGQTTRKLPSYEEETIDEWHTESVALLSDFAVKETEILVPSTVTPPNKCNENNYINLIQGDAPLPDSAFNASSVSSKFFSPKFAKLQSGVSDVSGGSWSPKFSKADEYLEINLGRLEPVYGVIIKGSPLYDEYVTSFKVYYSADGSKYCYVIDDDKRPQIFRGSLDSSTPVKQIFPIPIEAKIIRINPQSWNNGISLRVELIGCKDTEDTVNEVEALSKNDDDKVFLEDTLMHRPVKQPQKTVSVTTTTTTTTSTTEFVKTPMGLDDGMMLDQQIVVSSVLSPQYGKTGLKLTEEEIWQPLTNSPTEFVQLDFLDKRYITGIVTKGGPDGWVTSYKVVYSSNGRDWNPILGDNLEDVVFLGNFDSKTPQINYLKRPINARYIKIIPLTWHKNIQLKIEFLGQFKPYPVVPELEKRPTPESSTTRLPDESSTDHPSELEPLETEKIQVPQKYCPGVVPLEKPELYECSPETWYDGTNCVPKIKCPCFVRNIPYNVGLVFEDENCAQCICRIGGVSYCKPKKCPKCEQGLRSTVMSTCQCSCQPCPESTTLCPTSNICIDQDLWCDGIQDCPDDEISCVKIVEPVQLKPGYIKETVTTQQTQTVVKEEICPKLECPPGFKTQETKSSPVVSAMFSTVPTSKTNYKGEYAPSKGGGVKRPPPIQKPTAPVEKTKKCPDFKCVSAKAPPIFVNGQKECPPATCPPNFVLSYESDDIEMMDTDDCPGYVCLPPPPPEAVCNITANTFGTFDNVEFEYDICNHIIARDLANDEWDLSLRKNCTKKCSRSLVIHHLDNTIVLLPDLSVEYDGYKYTVDQTKKIGSQTQAFSISRLGNTLLFTSNRYGFWMIWDIQGNVKLGVVRKLIRQVDGLCGYFNDNPHDDKRKPDGTLAKTTTIFGDSWALSDPDQSNSCEEKICPVEMKNIALNICNKVKDETFEMCRSAVEIQSFISRCVETTCECLEANEKKVIGEEECKCTALQSFVIDCLMADSTVDLSHWRMQQDCPATCDAPMVYHDCYQKKCEPTCGTISNPDACPTIPNVCFPGCYCPPGMVKKGDTCIQASTCRDCECNVLPFLKYETYDLAHFDITGNCTYVMSRDVVTGKGAKRNFEVLITNGLCSDTSKNQTKNCVEKVTIIVKGQKVEVFNNKLKKELKLIVNGKAVPKQRFQSIPPNIDIKRSEIEHVKFILVGMQAEISVYYPSLGTSIKVPSHRYGGKLEGLCGDCNKEADDDLPDRKLSDKENANRLAIKWAYRPNDTEATSQCSNLPVKECPEVPAESDPCLQILDTNKFGQCLRIQDPGLFIEWCKKDSCGSQPQLACNAINAYATECAFNGFCINWRTNLCPADTCEAGKLYKACGTSCPKTCKSIKEKTTNCKDVPEEGCFCPEGKVLMNETCVVEKDCEVCDDEGHHPGDEWKKDKCTSCTCDGKSLIKCETEKCSGINTICEKGYAAVKMPAGDDECCDKYVCAPAKLTATCEPPQKVSCGPGQMMKLIQKDDGCHQSVCECKPPDQCEDVTKAPSKPLDPGYVKEIDTSGCCPIAKFICKPDLCPKPPNCPQYHNLDKIEIPGRCCCEYKCQPPKDKCIYEMQYTAAAGGGARPMTTYEKQQLIKNLNDTWHDGPCRSCKCISLQNGEKVDSCTMTECPSLDSSPDTEEYVLDAMPVFEQCCPLIKRIACKYGSKTYGVGEKWIKDRDYCTTFECKNTTNGIQKETLVTNCDTNCDLGYKYEAAPKDSKKCCGTCKPTACVVDGVVHQIDDEWKSLDYCTNFYCVFVNGSAQVQAFLVNCPQISDDDKDNYEFATVPVDGECCKKYEVTACKVNGKVYKLGETAPAPDANKCKKINCIKNDKGEIIKQTNIETCNTDCAKGFEYQNSVEKCCGECVPVACVVGEDIKAPGEQWQSDDKCTTFICDQIGDQLTVSGQQESCPTLDNCNEENIYVKGCCKYCNLTSESQTTCSPSAIPELETIGLIKENHTTHGLCFNKHSLFGFMECDGSCHSSTSYNSVLGAHESKCECCRGLKYKPTEIELECKDGFTFKKKVSFPISCRCQGCTGPTAGIKNTKT